MNTTQTILVFAAVSSSLALSCAAKKDATQTTVSGRLAPDGYPSLPISLVATDESGHTHTSTLRADGAFSIGLTKGHTYRFSVATENRVVPVVFPRRSGKLETRLGVRSNGGRVEFGRVRYLPSVPQGGFQFVTSGAVQTRAVAPGQSRGAGDCVDCVDDHQDVNCDNGTQGHDDDGEKADDANDAVEVQQGLSVPDRNPPETVNGCDENENEHDGDNVDEQGEH